MLVLDTSMQGLLAPTVAATLGLGSVRQFF